MKTSAIIRIVLYTLLLLVLLSILLGGILLGKLILNFSAGIPSGEKTTAEHSADAAEFSNLEIDWAAGTIKIVTADTDQITVKEVKDTNNRFSMVTEYDDDTLKVSYGEHVSINLGSLSGKDLIITVPLNWACGELTINGAALDIEISNLNVGTIDLDGAATELAFRGSLKELECDGAAAELKLNCSNAPDRISIDGAACELDLTLPANSGFQVEADGLAIEFDSDLAYSFQNGAYIYGNGQCKVRVYGLGCMVSIEEGAESLSQEQLHYNMAEAKLGESKFKAAIAFGKLGNYLDARQRSRDLWEQILDHTTVVQHEAGLYGILSDGSVIFHSHLPNPLPETENWTNMRAFASGRSHFVGLKADGTVVAEGSNEYGQCDVTDWTDIVAIDCGWDFTVGLKTDGTVVYTGISGGASEANTWTNMTMIEAEAENIIGLTADGTANAAGRNDTGTSNIPNGNDIIHIYLDHERAIYLHKDGRLDIMGNALYINAERISGLQTVESDGIYLAGRMEDGSMYFDGYDQQLPDSQNTVAIVDYSCRKMALKKDGTLELLFFYSESMAKTPQWTNLLQP